MRKILIFLLSLIYILSFTNNVLANGDVNVKGYYRSDGTYVKPYHRSAPDGNFNNNWSTEGNINPYTGKEGTKERNTNLNSDEVYYNGQYYRITKPQLSTLEILWRGFLVLVVILFFRNTKKAYKNRR